MIKRTSEEVTAEEVEVNVDFWLVMFVELEVTALGMKCGPTGFCMDLLRMKLSIHASTQGRAKFGTVPWPRGRIFPPPIMNAQLDTSDPLTLTPRPSR